MLVLIDNLLICIKNSNWIMLANTLELIGDFYVNTGDIKNAIYSYS